MAYDDPCAYCLHARDMHTPRCQITEDLSASGERPEGTYACACEAFREQMARCNVVHVEDGPDGSLKLYIDEGLFVSVVGDEAEALREVWERDGVLFIPIPSGDRLLEE